RVPTRTSLRLSWSKLCCEYDLIALCMVRFPLLVALNHSPPRVLVRRRAIFAALARRGRTALSKASLPSATHGQRWPVAPARGRFCAGQGAAQEGETLGSRFQTENR